MSEDHKAGLLVNLVRKVMKCILLSMRMSGWPMCKSPFSKERKETNQLSPPMSPLMFGFSMLGSFGLAAHELPDRVCWRYRIHARVAEWEAHALVHCRQSFAVMRGVADQFVDRRLVSFRWWFTYLHMFLYCDCSLFRARCACPCCYICRHC